MEKIVLVGAGGHCKVIIDIIKSTGNYEIFGVTDKAFSKENIGSNEQFVLDIPIIGDDDMLPELYNNGVKNAFVCIGALGNMKIRDKIFNNLKSIGFRLPVLIHKEAIVSPYSKVLDGTCVMAGSIINPGTTIEENCIINTGAVVEHDCIINRNSHISPNACVAGGTKIGYNSHVGIGSSIIQGVSIGNNSIIGAGAVVIGDIEDNVVAVGVPAKIIKRR